MSGMTSQITSLVIVYSTVYSGADKKNTKALRNWPLYEEFTGDPWIPRTKGQQRGKCFHLMTSSWFRARKSMIVKQFPSPYVLPPQQINHFALVYDFVLQGLQILNQQKLDCFFKSLVTLATKKISKPSMTVYTTNSYFLMNTPSK